MIKKQITLLGVFLFLLLGTAFSQTVIVCGGQYATRYHATKTCTGLNNCKGGLYEKTLDEAIAMDRTPCHICYQVSERSNSSSSSKSTATQCTGITKSGNRCKRMTTNANGRCYQH